MRDLKEHVLLVPYLGIIVCSIALFTPAAFFENTIWNHEIINWIWGFFQEKFNSTVTGGFYSNPIQIVPSVITSSIILACILIITDWIGQTQRRLKKGNNQSSQLYYFCNLYN